jgi:nitroreductase
MFLDKVEFKFYISVYRESSQGRRDAPQTPVNAATGVKALLMTRHPAPSRDLAELRQPSRELSPMPAIEAVRGRRSVRRFLTTPVPLGVIREILNEAARAPSGTNIQPWKVHVVAGAARDQLSEAVLEAADADQRCDEYAYMPATLREPYLSRRRQIGFELYRLYGIERTDLSARKEAALRNYKFFGAPVGIFFTMDSDLLHGSWLDCGMFMQNVMILARAYGLETCPQQAWCEYGRIVHEQLNIPDEQIILSGMAVGYQDPDAPENKLESPRIRDGEFATYHLD